MERGFDKLMTPMGLNAVVFAMFFFFVVIAAGGVWWRLREQTIRRDKNPAPSPDGSNKGP